MENYYFNWSIHTGNYLIFKIGNENCLMVVGTKKEVETIVKQLNEQDNDTKN